MTLRSLGTTLVVLAGLAAPLGATPRAAWAQEDASAEAAAEFEAGLTALERSEFQAAAEHFEASSRLETNGAALFAAGKAWLAEGNRARAADSFAAALETSLLREAEVAHAEKQLASLQAELAVLEISGDESMSVSLPDRAVVSPPATLHAEPGTVTLVVGSEGREKNIEVILVAGERVPIDLRPALVRSPAKEEPETSEPAVEPPVADSNLDLYRRIAIFGGIGTAVGVAFTVSFGVLALGAKSDFESDPTRANFDQAIRFETGTNVALVATGIVGVASATFLTLSLVLEPDDARGADRAETAQVTLGARPGGVVLTGRF